MYEYRAKVIDVVDGDTLRLAVDLGCDTTLKMTVRLWGINCPEMSTQGGAAAKDFAINWLIREVGYLNDPNYWVILRTVKDKKEKYGRYLGVVYGSEGAYGVSLNTALAEAGHAVRYLPS